MIPELTPALLRRWYTDLRQVSGGPFRGVVKLVAIGSVRIMRVAVNRVIQARGAVSANAALISLVTPLNEGATWRNQRRKRGDINVNTPSSEIDHLTGQQYDNLTIIADADRLQAVGDTLLGGNGGSCLDGPNRFRPTAQSFTALESSVHSILDLARVRSEFLGSPAERARVEETLMAQVVTALAGERIHAAGRAAPDRHRVARRGEELMLATLRQSLLMTDLCKELGVSERTLRYAFHDCFGVSPLAYFKVLKLNAIRRQIARNSWGGGVQEIARHWGIVHLGNFAADYRRLFGEAPSETARQVRRSV